MNKSKSVQMIDDSTITETITIQYKYTIDDIKKAVTNFKRPSSGLYPGVRQPAAYDRCMKLLSGLISRYRSDIMATWQPYRIITNGYGEFVRVETDEYGIDANKVFDLLKELVK